MDKVEAIEAMAEAMWRAESLRAAGRDRLVRWSETNPEIAASWRDAATAALTAAEPFFADVRDQWLPIETAPKDGTPIVAWCVHPYASSMIEPKDYVGPVIAYWIEHNGGGWTWHGHLGNFTHWRPLPDPPVLDEVGG